MPIVTGKNSFGLPRLKATPIASPSIKLWIKELIKFKKPVDYFETTTAFPFFAYSYFFYLT